MIGLGECLNHFVGVIGIELPKPHRDSGENAGDIHAVALQIAGVGVHVLVGRPECFVEDRNLPIVSLR